VIVVVLVDAELSGNRCGDLPSDETIRQERTRIAARVAAIEDEKRHTIDLYVSHKLRHDAYVTTNRKRSGEARHMNGALRFRIERTMRRIKTLLGPKNKGYQSGPGARDGHSANQD
jgi:hypothetical protein